MKIKELKQGVSGALKSSLGMSGSIQYLLGKVCSFFSSKEIDCFEFAMYHYESVVLNWEVMVYVIITVFGMLARKAVGKEDLKNFRPEWDLKPDLVNFSTIGSITLTGSRSF